MQKDKKNLLFTEASLVDSKIYQSFNRNAAFDKRIIAGIKNSTRITRVYIEEQLMQIKRTRISPLVNDVINAFDRGDIVLLYSKDTKIPISLPFFATRVQGKIKVFVFLNNYGTLAKTNTDTLTTYLSIQMKDLYVLMEGAYISYKYNLNKQKVERSLGLMRVSSAIYTQMVMRILNKEYAISMDENLNLQATFSVGMFFAERVWMSTNDAINTSYSRNNIISDSNNSIINQIHTMYKDANILSVDQLIDFISALSPRLKTLNFRYFLQCFINTYKPGAMLGLEVLPYFLYDIEATLCGSFLVNQPIISDICKNIQGMNTFTPQLVKAVS